MQYLTQRHQMRRPLTLRSLARQCALSVLALRDRPDTRPSLRIIYCHYVLDDQVHDFERKVSWLAERGRFVDADEVVRVLEGTQPLTETLFHISFDDGFRNIVTNALPVLESYGVPSTFFVPTAIVSADEDTIRHYCLVTTKYPGVMEMASWDELGDARERRMTIASHTRTHARFSSISASPAQLEDEIAGSKEDLEARLGVPCNYISWPYGRRSDADAGSLAAAQAAGYRACFGAYRGKIVPGQTDRFAIPRHHFEPEWPMHQFRYFVHGNQET